jgi:HK97 family phage portal protein
VLERLLYWLGWERRAVSYNDPALQRLYGGGASTASGEPVNVERAAGLSAVWACVTLIAGTIASMPLILYRRVDEERERAIEHPLFDVLRVRPNPVQSVVSFWEAMVTALLLRGNAYAMITRDDDGRVRALWYVNPDRVQVDVTKTGRLKYRVTAGGSSTTVDATGMLHVVGPMSDDGYTGRSVITAFRETLALSLAIERYGGEFFGNAATPAGMLTHPGALSSKAQTNLLKSLEEAHAARGKRHRMLLLEEGLKFEPIGVSHEDSQYIDSRRFGVEEVARIFGVPGFMIGANVTGSSLTYSNAETEGLRLLKHTIGPWLARIESAVNFACISPLERRQMYCEFLADSLLSTDTRSRYEAYKLGVEGGWLTREEVRRRENLPALPAAVAAEGP